MTPAQAAAELLSRRRARQSLIDFSLAVEIPGVPSADDGDEWLFKPVETTVAAHHRLMMLAIQRCIETDYGRLMIFAPPGSAKSSFASVVAPAWAMGRTPEFRAISVSYAATPAERSAKRCRQLCNSDAYRGIFGTSIKAGSGSVTEWELENGSGLLSAGILGAVTSARADLMNIDDPVAGREEADSETIQRKTWQAYQDDLMTRLKPRASVILVQTRWNMNDLAGMLLPEDYDGRSGPVLCRDGREWQVLCLTARCERTDDPLGRKIGEYLWPEWFDREHWLAFEGAGRTWSALYQQQPVPETGGQFERDWFKLYRPEDKPARLNVYGASDYAVTEHRGDWTEHGVVGIDAGAELWLLDWWYGQEASDNSLAAWDALRRRWKPLTWFGERGVIENAIGPARDRMMLDAAARGAAPTVVELLPSVADKVAKVASFRARARLGMVHVPDTPWGRRLIDQLVRFPAGRHDDAVDVCGMIGRGVDQLWEAPKPTQTLKSTPETPFSYAAMQKLMAMDRAEEAKRNKYFD